MDKETKIPERVWLEPTWKIVGCISKFIAWTEEELSRTLNAEENRALMIPYVPAASLERAVTKLRCEQMILRAEMVELLEGLRLDGIVKTNRVNEAWKSCQKYLDYLRDQEAKAQSARENKGVKDG